jgi:hypothetical protein
LGAFSPAADAAGENRAFRSNLAAKAAKFRFNRLRGSNRFQRFDFTKFDTRKPC